MITHAAARSRVPGRRAPRALLPLAVGVVLAALRTAIGQCPPPPPLELLTLNGAYAGDNFAYSVAGVGDVDGDAMPDLLVGAPHAGIFGIPDVGQAKVISGTNGIGVFTLIGSNSGDQFGSSVAAAGDLNSDGVPDLLVGGSIDASTPGQVKAVSGASGATLFTLNGTSAGDEFGRSIAGVGDLNADAVPDILVGARNADPFGMLDAGQAYVFSGSDGTVLRTLDGTSPSDFFGFSVAGVGDLNADGVPDLLVGAPHAYPGGQARAVSGANGSTLYTLEGTNAGDYFGWSVSGVGDLDADGVPDLLVGAPEAAPSGVPYAGQARALSGASGIALFTLDGTNAYDSFGSTIAGAGDQNGDGVPDLLVGAPLADLFGVSDVGEVKVYSGANGAALFTFDGSNAGDRFGHSLGTAGDLNLDGVTDFLIGAPYADSTGIANSGQVKVLSITGVGGSGASTPFGTGCPGSGGAFPVIGTTSSPCIGNSNFGLSVSNALGGTVAVLITGFSASSYQGVPLPMNLAPLGVPGCFLLVSPDLLSGAGTTGSGAGSGSATTGIPIPPIAGLLGASAYFQWYVVDPGPSILPGAMSEGLYVQVG